jgi:hypothetical protein
VPAADPPHATHRNIEAIGVSNPPATSPAENDCDECWQGGNQSENTSLRRLFAKTEVNAL